MEVMVKMPKNELQNMDQMVWQKMLNQYDEVFFSKHFTQIISDLFNSRNL